MFKQQYSYCCHAACKGTLTGHNIQRWAFLWECQGECDVFARAERWEAGPGSEGWFKVVDLLWDCRSWEHLRLSARVVTVWHSAEWLSIEGPSVRLSSPPLCRARVSPLLLFTALHLRVEELAVNFTKSDVVSNKLKGIQNFIKKNYWLPK